MVKSGLQQSYNQHNASPPAASEGGVLVVATRQSDAVALCEILSRAGYESHWCGGRLQTADSLSLGKFMATVYCHRAQSRPPEAGSGLLDLPGQFPNHSRCKRVIAVSDCMAEQTVITLLNEGADFCFNLLESPRILQARLEAALRHHAPARDRLLTLGDIWFDLQKRRVIRSGCVVDLSPKEYELAYYLFSNRDRIVENGELLTSIWSLPAGMDTRRIDTAACRVRKKLRLTAEHGWELKRMRRIGYRLVRAMLPEA
jgi:hypothetical protein